MPDGAERQTAREAHHALTLRPHYRILDCLTLCTDNETVTVIKGMVEDIETVLRLNPQDQVLPLSPDRVALYHAIYSQPGLSEDALSGVPQISPYRRQRACNFARRRFGRGGPKLSWHSSPWSGGRIPGYKSIMGLEAGVSPVTNHLWAEGR